MKAIEIRRLRSSDPEFPRALEELKWQRSNTEDEVGPVVRTILADVRARGDSAVLDYSRRFDSVDADAVSELEIGAEEMRAALQSIPPIQRDALEFAATRIREFHLRQQASSWSYIDEQGVTLGQLVQPLDRVGVYVPGGKAAYPSSVLMNVVPAHVAGVNEIVMVVPTPRGERNNLVLAAAALAGVTRVFSIGGAQAIGALAYGTQTIPAVDKIVGPGNAYVAAAKREVFGLVGIDMIAGPSEIVVICDGGTPSDWIALDLFSQAEHDELAQAILIAPDAAFLDKVLASMENLLGQIPRGSIVLESLRRRGAMIEVRGLDEACAVANQLAPEHLELSIEDPNAWLPKIRHAGAIFLGRYIPEAVGDYCAGPNHVLPTSGTARFSSPLGVADFQKRSSIIGATRHGAARMSEVASILARGEGLVAHALSVEMRLKASE